MKTNNIVAIDLARHPEADKWLEDRRHDYATDWIMSTLECGRPYDVTEWPFRSSLERLVVPEILNPVEVIISEEPVDEPDPPTSNEIKNLFLVQELLDAWTHNRKIYPGWIAVPVRAQGQLSQEHQHMGTANPTGFAKIYTSGTAEGNSGIGMAQRDFAGTNLNRA